MTRSPYSGSSSFFYTVFLPAHPFAKNMLIQLLRKSFPLLFISLFFGGLFLPPPIQARPTVGVLSV
ncbi:MAG: hypothetical protein P8L36_04740, partial [SAR324 cluster bacterium]|nr:hypothetical protein [SAR324 cluster bacterium]